MVFDNGPHLIVATFCEQAIEDKTGVLSLIRIVDRKNVTAEGPNAPKEMPPVPLDWVLVLNFKSGQAKGSYQIKVEPELPSGIRLEPFTLSAHFEGGNRGVNIIVRPRMKIEMTGIYWFRVYVEDEFVTKIPIEVIYTRISRPGPKLQSNE